MNISCILLNRLGTRSESIFIFFCIYFIYSLSCISVLHIRFIYVLPLYQVWTKPFAFKVIESCHFNVFVIWPPDGDTPSDWPCHPQVTLYNPTLHCRPLLHIIIYVSCHRPGLQPGSLFAQETNNWKLLNHKSYFTWCIFCLIRFLERHITPSLYCMSLRCHGGADDRLSTFCRTAGLLIQIAPTCSKSMDHTAMTWGFTRKV